VSASVTAQVAGSPVARSAAPPVMVNPAGKVTKGVNPAQVVMPGAHKAVAAPPLHATKLSKEAVARVTAVCCTANIFISFLTSATFTMNMVVARLRTTIKITSWSLVRSDFLRSPNLNPDLSPCLRLFVLFISGLLLPLDNRVRLNVAAAAWCAPGTRKQFTGMRDARLHVAATMPPSQPIALPVPQAVIPWPAACSVHPLGVEECAVLAILVQDVAHQPGFEEVHEARLLGHVARK